MNQLVFETYKGDDGDWRWRLKARNGKILADSAEGYRNKVDCDRGIELLKHYVATAPVTPVLETILSARPIGLRGF